jgi:hypothetical protein
MKPLILNVNEFPEDFDFHNNQFPPLDALTYWHFLKKARKVVEVGCGYSTLLASKSNIEITAIDPSPRIYYPDIAYLEYAVQDIKLDCFLSLNPNDILFIDSSHIYSEGSDVQYLIDFIIPQLSEGVLIHFHDYFGNEGYPQEWSNIPEMKGWNENQYVIPLTSKYKVLADNYEISKNYNEQLKIAYPFVPKNITNNLGAVKGASLWLKK